MKPKNFPERKLRRQKKALERQGKPDTLPLSLRHIRTKKRRTA